MSFEDEQGGERRRKPEPTAGEEAPSMKPQTRKKRPLPEVGNALRSAYQQTVNEDIPPEMLDLLGKLG